MALGETLRKARLSRKMTASQVGAATRMKVQFVEAIEREDFARIPAPIYAKGFIRLYAEYVGLDARPLIEEYNSRFAAAATPPSLRKASLVQAANEPSAEPAPPPPGAAPTAEAVSSSRAAVEPPALGASDGVAPLPAQGPRPAVVYLPPRPSSGFPGRLAAVWDGGVQAWRGAREWFLGSCRECMSYIGTGRLPTAARWKLIAVLAGLLIILVFVVSALTRCAGHVAKSPVGAGQMPIVAAEPPEPYFD